jgi:hypothetical protein
MKTIIAAAAGALPAVMLAMPALAQGQTCLRYGWNGWRWTCLQWGSSGGGSGVPEINAGAGLLAVAAVAATVLILWERRRRASV